MGDKESVREGWRDIDIGQEIVIDRGGDSREIEGDR